jgi:hypothetical protein
MLGLKKPAVKMRRLRRRCLQDYCNAELRALNEGGKETNQGILYYTPHPEVISAGAY